MFRSFFMKLEHLERAFGSIGARLRVEASASRRGSDTGYALDIGHDREGQFFALRGGAADLAKVEFTVLQKQGAERHLLLFAKGEAGSRKDRFLCGHDEREWFVAAVPGTASTVLQAKEALKPAPVKWAQARKGLNARQANMRHNAAFRRQGEWFFLPVEQSVVVDPKLILRREPISRGGGSKPHLVEEVYRQGGEVVYVCDRYPGGLSKLHYESIIKRDAKAKRLNWREARRNAGVFARGAVRHPDHATIVLRDWHQVIMNAENEAPSMRSLAFID
jgi:hypothetical protein